MIRYCKRCKFQLSIPELTEEQKLKFWGIRNEGLFIIKELMSSTNLSKSEAKAIKIHINEGYGKCIRCNKLDLIGENIECPKCKAFNLNWKINLSFNEEFCIQLEYKINELIKQSEIEALNGFWCDGISWKPNNLEQLSKKNVKNRRKIETNMWLGKSGQDKYNLTINLGSKSLSRYAKGQELFDCIPNSSSKNWIEIDIESMNMQIKLN